MATLPTLTQITLGSLVSSLQSRLAISGDTFWSAAELRLYLVEAFRTWNAAARYWRDRAVLQTAAGSALYDLSETLTPAHLARSVTDRDLVTAIQYHLLEPATPTSWTGTAMFALADLVQAIERRRDQFLIETGCVVLAYTAPVVSPPPNGRIALDAAILDVRRAAWRSAAGAWTQLWRDDEVNASAFLPGWALAPGDPQAYSLAMAAPSILQTIPPPADAGSLELLVVAAGAVLDPAMPVSLGVPDDFAWVVKWGALADLLGRDGPARDPQRAAYCEKRWQDGLELARMSATVLQAEVNGSQVDIDSLANLDALLPDWRDDSGAPDVLAIAATNLVALSKVPDGIYSVTLDVVRNAPAPTADVTQVAVSRDVLDALLDYAEHLAAFKMSGAEFEATGAHYERLMRLAATYNELLAARAQNFEVLAGQSRAEDADRPMRRKES